MGIYSHKLELLQKKALRTFDDKQQLCCTYNSTAHQAWLVSNMYKLKLLKVLL